jgi:hypothetical protein
MLTWRKGEEMMDKIRLEVRLRSKDLLERLKADLAARAQAGSKTPAVSTKTPAHEADLRPAHESTAEPRSQKKARPPADHYAAADSET